MNVAPQYVSLRQLSTYASLSVKTLKGYLVDREHPLPHFKLLGKILIRKDDFDAWIEHYRQGDVPRQAGCDVDALVRAAMAGLELPPGGKVNA
jgi:Helix-turn-helix domain